MADRWYESAFGAFYPVLYAHRDDREAARCLRLLPRLAPLGPAPGATVLDLGCGDGRHLAPLAATGLRVVGLDLSAPLLAAARGRAPGAALVRGDMRRLPFAAGSLAAVLSLFTAFGYFGAEGGDRDVAVGIGRALRPGGHWFLDFLDADRVRAELAGGEAARRRVAGPLAVTETRRLDGGFVVKDVRLEPLPGRAAEAGALGVGAEGLGYAERVALHPLAALDDMAAAGRMRRVAGAGSYEGAELGAGTRWLLAYRREDCA